MNDVINPLPLASVQMLYNLNSEADSEISQYSTSCCARLLIFGDKQSTGKHRPLLCVPPCSC